MRKKIFTLGCLFAFAVTARPQKQDLGLFEEHGDIGNPAKAGSVVYISGTQEYTIEGSGTNMWKNADQFHFLWKKIKGDFIITATIKFAGPGINGHRKIG